MTQRPATGEHTFFHVLERRCRQTTDRCARLRIGGCPARLAAMVSAFAAFMPRKVNIVLGAERMIESVICHLAFAPASGRR
jgi:hypothetical protein